MPGLHCLPCRQTALIAGVSVAREARPLSHRACNQGQLAALCDQGALPAAVGTFAGPAEPAFAV